MPQPNHPKIELVSIASLTPNPRNARTHTDKQISQIAASIEQFGWLVPIIIDDNNMIAAGHGRWLAAKLKKLSGWDDAILADELSILFEDGYNLDITGFSTSDLDFSVPEEVV
ncbi:MAG: ParB/Srx family N-terminal domain-containing protein [Marinomonas sp.]|uniref:ParB/Srx family N-terminal domain-containing protein n=1 Tax=Parasphingorhabdus sp. TaxID=2709688 RepID=UPI003288F47E